jgi:hypothetical protein
VIELRVIETIQQMNRTRTGGRETDAELSWLATLQAMKAEASSWRT